MALVEMALVETVMVDLPSKSPKIAVDLIPEGMDPVAATAFYSAYGSSCHALVQRGRVAAETLLALGTVGGVGLAATVIEKAPGARVIAAAGGDAKVDAARRHGRTLSVTIEGRARASGSCP